MMTDKGRSEELLSRIEKLIVDGNKEVLQKVAQAETNLGLRIDGIETRIDGVESRLSKKIDAVHASLKTEIKVTGYALKDEIKDKMDEHLKLAHV